MSPLSCNKMYMGMIHSVMSWAFQAGLRGQRKWREMMEKLQYTSLRKCMGAVVGARKG